ncbi:MAG: thiamine phosphate synthase [Alphaproteobacteria bacterium]|nr:thiamine phosphate synthase [Alphaproteobacteria bacterium]
MASPDLIRLWRIARALQSRAARVRGLPPLWFMTDRRRVADPLAVAAALPRGAGVILRDYDMPAREALASDLAGLCRQRGLVFLVAGDSALAARVGADGVHLPEWQVRGARIPRRRFRLLTGAAHSATALHQACRAGLDAALLSPVFATASHPGAPHLGAVRFAGMARRAGLPIYALGGIDATSAARLRPAGAAGIAAIGAVARAAGEISASRS